MGLRQVQLPVNQRVPARGSIAKVDRDLGVLDPARGAGVLPLHPRRGGALLDVPRLINLCGCRHRLIYADTVTMPRICVAGSRRRDDAGVLRRLTGAGAGIVAG
jgi:hypothetical protein